MKLEIQNGNDSRRMFLPDAIETYKMVRQFKPTGVVTQVLTGYGGLSEYLNRFGCKDNPSCICEPGIEETVAHILFECPVFGLERYDAEQE